MTTFAPRRYADLPWIRNPRFDTGFTFGLPAISLAVFVAVSLQPALFYPILIIDLWLLGYHHVVATFTRLAFDKQSFRENRFLVLGVTPLIAIATGLVAWLVGLWAIVVSSLGSLGSGPS